MRKLIINLLLGLVTGVAVAQTTTPSLGLNLPALGQTHWDQPLNANFVALDQFLSGVKALPPNVLFQAPLQIGSVVNPTIVSSCSNSGIPVLIVPTINNQAQIAICQDPTTGALTFLGSVNIIGHFTDFPSFIDIPVGTCAAAGPTAASSFSTPATNAAGVNCATGTNTNQAALTFAHSQSAQFVTHLPPDWDNSSNVDAVIYFTSSSTSGTVIFDIATSCTNTNGSQIDDQPFNANNSFQTITLGSPASAHWQATAPGITVTGCSPGEALHLKITRDASDTAADTGVQVRGLGLTVRRTF